MMSVDPFAPKNALRFVLNGTRDTMGCQVCIHDLAARLSAAGYRAQVNDWEDYRRYDVAVFMGVEADIERARAQNPDIRIVIADPKQSSTDTIAVARAGDLLLVSSIEQKEAFLRLNANILVYPMFPEVSVPRKVHGEANPIMIAYHGNKVHIEAMQDMLAPALEALAARTPVRFMVIYNIDRLGRAVRGLPNPDIVPTEHVQWTPSVYRDRLLEADIGVVPNLLPVWRPLHTLRSAEVPGLNVNYEPFDYLLRFKASTNPWRVSVFAKLGIPVVSEFTPSACQLIEDGRSGFLVGSAHGWYACLAQLASSAALRAEMGALLSERVEAVQRESFCRFVAAVERPKAVEPIPPMAGIRTAEQDLAHYRPPGNGGLRARVVRRLRRFLR